MVLFLKEINYKIRISINYNSKYTILNKNEKITTNLDAVDDSDVIHKSYLDEKLKNINGHL